MAEYKPVKLSEINHELETLEKLHLQSNQLRASLFNLIVYAQKDQRLPYFVEIVEQIVSQFPCRVIFIEEQPHEGSHFLDASIAAKMIEVADSPSVVCDRIYLRTSKNNTEQLLHLLLEHLLVDLPIYLLWGQDPTLEHPLFPFLKHTSKRIIFQSECSNNLQELAQKLLANIIKENWEVADLNWILLQEWREVIKGVFNSPQHLNELKNASALHIELCATPSEYFCHNHFQVHYLHAWIASLMGWEFISCHSKEGQTSVHYHNGSQRVEVNISPQKCKAEATYGTLLKVQLKSLNKKVYTFDNASGMDQFQIEIKDEEKPDEVYNTTIMKTKWQVYLSKEICYKETSKHYKSTLQLLSKIDGLV